MSRTLFLRHAAVHLTERYVVTCFADQTSAVLDVEQGDNAAYRAVAAACGYRDWRRYARHHDVTHNLLAELALDAPSPALWDAAHRVRADHDLEEFQVNTIQWTWATCSRYRHGSFGAWYGPRWRGMVGEICQKLEDIR